VGIADLDRIDIVAAAPDGRERWIMVAGIGFPDEDEAELIVTLLLKLGMHERHAEHVEPRPALELASFTEPPRPVLEFLTARGVEVRVGSPSQPAVGKPSAFGFDADGIPELAALQAANARRFAERYGLPHPPELDALPQLDTVIATRREEEGLDEDETDEELADTQLMVLAGAYAGEVLRQRAGGRWRFDPSAMGLQPVWLAAGPEGSFSANVLGKVGKALKYGSGDSLAWFVESVMSMTRR
jgi:hypothetical protein